MTGTLIDHMVGAVRGARLVESPFLYLALEKIFPEDVYAAMLRAMPSVDDYRAMSGRSKSARREDGSPTRVKMDLFPEFIRHLPAAKRRVWAEVGVALRSDALRLAFVERLATALQRRFGPQFALLGHYVTPIFTRDSAGYQIGLAAGHAIINAAPIYDANQKTQAHQFLDQIGLAFPCSA